MHDVAALTNLTRISLFSNNRITNNGIQLLAPLTKLQRIGLYDTGVRTGIMEILASQFPNLQHASFRSTHALDAAGYRTINLLTTLTRLSLQNSRISDAEMPAVGELVRLTRLSMANTAVSQAGLMHLSKLTNLEVLVMTPRRLASSLAPVAPMRKLRVLRVGQVDANLHVEEGACLGALKSLHNLTALDVSGPFCDEHVPYFACLNALRSLRIGKSSFTSQGVSIILDNLPYLDSVSIQCATADDANRASQLADARSIRTVNFSMAPASEKY
jgi:hypothetical protein